MTCYLDVQAVSALVKKAGVKSFLTSLAHFIEQDYRRWPEFDKAARVAHHTTLGVIELMPIADRALYGFKYVNGHPGNALQDLSTVMAFGGLAEMATGLPLLLSELTLMTGLRTAATSALAARSMARRDSASMAMIGNGAQSEFQVMAFHHMLGISEIRAFDIDPAATDKLIDNLAGIDGLTITRATSAQAAVAGADIVTTLTADKTNADILTAEMIEPGMHINAVGGDCPGKTELHPEVLKAASVVVEYEPQARIEGDIQRMPPDFPVTELWRVLTQKVPGRVDDGQVTVFDSVGFAIEDFSALRYLHSLCKAQGVGQKLDLVPDLADPKNLYALINSDRQAGVYQIGEAMRKRS